MRSTLERPSPFRIVVLNWSLPRTGVLCLAVVIGLTTNDRRPISPVASCTDSNFDSLNYGAKAERSEVVEVGGRGGYPGGWVLASTRRETAKRDCGAVVGRCCPAPALCERNGEAARNPAVQSLRLDSGGVR